MFSRKLDRIKMSAKTLKNVEQYVDKDDWKKQTSEILTFKDEFKKLALLNQDEKCAYCERNIIEIFPEIEHVALKSVFPKQMFNPQNLVYSCKRCNFPPNKGTNNVVTKSNGIYEDWSFSIIHPYFDNPCDYYEPLEISCVIKIKKSLNGDLYDKAKRTIDLFHLNNEELITQRKKDMMYDALSEVDRNKLLEISLYR